MTGSSSAPRRWRGEWDTITDFDPVLDPIRLGARTFGLAKAVLAEDAFADVADGLAQEADGRILYDRATGALYWNADGVGGTPRRCSSRQCRPGWR